MNKSLTLKNYSFLSYSLLKYSFLIISLIFLSHSIAYSQIIDSINIVESEGIVNDMHRANIGKVTFMEKFIPFAEFKESGFINTFEYKETSPLNMRVFLANSLTNYLHQLAPELTADELVKKGNYQFSFYVDDKLVYKEDLHFGAGTPESKNKKTIFSVPLISPENEDSWGRFLWNRFMLRGGDDAFTSGSHDLKIEIRPYVKINNDVKVGDIIASGSLKVNVPEIIVAEELMAVQTIAPGSGFETSPQTFNIELIREMNKLIAGNKFKDITSIIVIKNGELFLEEYFNGADRTTLHDTRSVGKSFVSALTGLAIADGFINNENEMLGSFYNLKDYANYSPEKEKITLEELLTMSSPFDGSDSDQDSPGNEENMYPTDNWVKFALDLPVNEDKIKERHWDYFTAGVVLIGDILNKKIPGGLEKYSDEKLFAPLGINNYKWQYTPQNVVNTAGGLQMPALDLAKFGQLYKNKGVWNGKQILPEDWINKSLSHKFEISENEYYGYLFWNKTFNVNGKDYETYYASGNGGNKIYIFKDEPVVIVITSTAYNTPYGHLQADKIMSKYLIPAVVGE